MSGVVGQVGSHDNFIFTKEDFENENKNEPEPRSVGVGAGAGGLNLQKNLQQAKATPQVATRATEERRVRCGGAF